MIYDAFGRRVEEPNPNGSGFIEILYGPDGSKLALISGASVAHASVPLPPARPRSIGARLARNLASGWSIARARGARRGGGLQGVEKVGKDSL